MTYRFALFSIQRGGLAAGINAGDDPATAVDGFLREVDDHVSSGQWRFFAASGLAENSDEALAGAIDRRAEAAGIIAAAATAHGRDLTDATVVIDRLDSASPEFLQALGEAGARIVAVGTSRGTLRAERLDPAQLQSSSDPETLLELGTFYDRPALEVEADVAFIGAKTGVVDHTNADAITAGLVVPIGLLPFTTKAAVMLQRRNVTLLPDFLSLAGGSLVTDGTATDPAMAATQVAEVTELIVADGNQLPSVSAALRAEAFLSTWHEPVFGRPFAP